MIHKVRDFIRSMRAIVGFSLLSLLAINGYFIQRFSQEVGHLSLLQDGVQTCFTRVQQTYTAKLLSTDQAVYLDKGFMQSTEECFAEAIAASEAKFKTAKFSVSKKLNTLASDVHWFHEKITPQAVVAFAATPEKVVVSNLGTRFEKLEIMKNDIIAKVDDRRIDILTSQTLLKWAFYLLVIFTPLVFLWELVDQRNKRRRNKEIEKRANKELSQEERPHHGTVEDIILSALRENHLIYCSKLFTRFHAQASYLYSSADLPKDEAGKLQVITGNKKEEIEAQVEKMWQESERTESRSKRKQRKLVINDTQEAQADSNGLDSVNLEEIITKVVDIHTSKIFTAGILLDLDLDENLEVRGVEEGLEQVFYHLLHNAIESCESSDSKNKKISISFKKLGGSAILSIADTGRGFSKDFLRGQVGLGQRDAEVGIGLTICREFMRDFGGQISFENNTDKKDNTLGGVVKLLFKISDQKKTGRRLLHLKKGKKKEILRQLNQNV